MKKTDGKPENEEKTIYDEVFVQNILNRKETGLKYRIGLLSIERKKDRIILTCDKKQFERYAREVKEWHGE